MSDKDNDKDNDNDKESDKPNEPAQTLLTFPCDFTIKTFGSGSQLFETTVLTIINKHTTSHTDRAIQSRPSANGKYCALSITVHVESKEQLDNIYKELSASPDVLMVL